MLTLTIPAIELWDSEQEIFVTLDAKTLRLEHSLVSLAKWESTWHKPFLSEKKLTDEETLDYIRCMTLTQNVSLDTYQRIDRTLMNKVVEYINDPMTATTFSKNEKGKKSREIVTAEIIYYWMIALNIPEKCEKWHLNRLLTLIRVCNIKNSPGKKMSMSERTQSMAALNAARKKKLGTRG